MADNHYPNSDSPEELSIDELLAEAKQQIDSAPGEMLQTVDEPSAPSDSQHSAAESMPLVPQDEDFTPDFGDAFDSYGEYEAPAPSEEEEYYDDGEELPESSEDDMPPPDKPRRKRKKRIIPLFVKVILYLVIVGLVAVGLGYGAWECAQDVLAFGRSSETLTVTIGTDDTVEDIAQMLKDQGVIKYPWLFEFYCNYIDNDTTMDPGTYVISYNYDYHALVNGMIANSPNRTTVRVMIPEGMTSAQIFALMEKNNVCSAADLEACAANTEFDYWFLEGLPYGESNRLEGFLFPDTYDFYENDSPERVLDKLLVNFEKKFSEEAQAQLEVLNANLADRLSSAGYDETYISAHRMTVYELITVASMVEKESAGADESGNIASVIYNRLCKPADFPYLNIDATVVYALGGVDGALTAEDLQVDSPYNTYNHAGLPAGPISNPGLSSITAALYPSESNYYYYALDKSTGYHHFSSTYDEHNAFLGTQNENE